MVLEDIGQAHGADLQARVGQPFVAGHGQDMGAQPADRTFLDRHHHFVRGDQLADQVIVQRLDEAQVGHGCRQAARVQRVRRLQRLGQSGAEREDRHLGTLAHDAPLADFQPLRNLGQGYARAVAARIAEGDGAAVVAGGGMRHVDQFRLVSRCHDDHVGQACQIGDVKAAGMGRAIGTDQPGAVYGEAHRQVLDRHVMHHLVIGALQEGGIDRAERPHPLRGEAGGKGHGMLFGNADVEIAIGVRRLELVQPGARRHGGGNGADRAVTRGFGQQGLGEDRGIARRTGGGLGLFAGDDVELLDAVVLVRRLFGRAIALALLRHDMDQARPFGGIADVFQDRHQLVDVVAIDRADIVKAQFLEQGAAHGHAAGELVRLLGGAVQRFG